MIITNNFVMLNYPKTGSEFARKMIAEVHKSGSTSFIEKIQYKTGLKTIPKFTIQEFPNIRDASHKNGVMDEHGIYSQIPVKHRHKTIVSIKRNIYDRYISLYEFRDWVKSPWLSQNELNFRFTDYKNISFHDFLELLFEHNPREKLKAVNRKLPIGPATSQFILFFFKEPFKILKSIDDDYINSNKYKNDMAKIHFLDQATLNQDLYNFLLQTGYKQEKIKFILSEKKINNSTPKEKTRDDYFTQELYNLVNQKEKFLLKMLKYDLND